MRDSGVRAEIEAIVGKDRFDVSPETLQRYASDMTECEPCLPEAVIFPVTTQEVQSLLLLFNRERIPVTPAVARTNLAGLTLPSRGGVVLDLSRMNKICEINEEDLYAIIEPGVTFGQMRSYLDASHPGLRLGYPLSPPETSVVCNCLLDGLGNFSLRHGAMADWINGIEAVLPTGEIIKAGSAALSPYWFSPSPMPDVIGLFVSWQGTTGIVTRMSVQLWPTRTYRRRGFVLCQSRTDGVLLMADLAKTDLFDDIGGLSWPAGKMLLGVPKPEKSPGEPDFMVYLDYSSDHKMGMRAKSIEIAGRLKHFRRQGMDLEDFLPVEDLVKLSPSFASLSEFPTRLGFLLDGPGGGLTWVGTYGPFSQAVKGITEASRMIEEAGRPPIIVARPMKGGHFGVLRFISVFDKNDPAEVLQVRDLNRRLARLLLDIGFIPYKAPRWAVDLFMERMDPGYASLLLRLKDCLDPHHIMNPGKWV